MLLDQLGSVFKVPGLAGTHRGLAQDTLSPDTPRPYQGTEAVGTQTSWQPSFRSVPRTVSVVTVGKHLAVCSPTNHTMTDIEEPLCLSPSCSSSLNAWGWSHGHGAQALLHCSGFASLRAWSCIPSVTSCITLLLGFLSLLATAHPFLHREKNDPQVFKAGRYFM